MKCRDNLARPMAGPIPHPVEKPVSTGQADYKGRRDLKSCHSEFHRIL